MSLRKYLTAIIVGGALLLTITPLLVANNLFFPFITGKAFFFRSLVEVMFGLWLVLLVVEPAARPKRSSILWAVLAFGLATTLATIFSQNPYKSFWSNFERMEGLLTYLHLVAYFLILVSVFQTKKLWTWLTHTSLGVSVIVSFAALIQFICVAAGHATDGKCPVPHQGFNRVDANLGNPTYLAVYLLVHIFLLLFLLFRDGDRRRKLKTIDWIYIATAIFESFVLWQTNTRGALLGFAVGLVTSLALVAILDVGRPRIRQLAGGILAILILLAGGFWLARETSFVQHNAVLSRFANISATDQTVESRLTIWGMSLEAFQEHPIVGWGPEAYNIVFNKYYEPKLWRQEQWFDRSHNVIFDWLVTTGLFGLGSYLAMLITALMVIWRKRESLTIAGASALTGLLVGYSVHNFFVFDNLSSYIFFFSLLGYLYYLDCHTGEVAETKPAVFNKDNEGWLYSIATGSLIVTLAMLYFFNYKPYVASANLIKALSPQVDLNENLNYFNQIFASNTFAFTETTEQMFQLALRIGGSEDAKTEGGQKILQLTFDKMKLETEREPLNTRGLLFLGSLLARFGQTDDALVYLDKALALSPRKQNILIEIASTYSISGDNTKALDYAKQAYELDHNYDEAVKVYGLLALQAGQTKLAESILLPMFGTTSVDDDRFIAFFSSLGRYDKVLNILTTRIKANPKDATTETNLAAVYYKLGDHASAILHVQKAIALDPGFTEAGQKIIDNIRAGRSPQ